MLVTLFDKVVEKGSDVVIDNVDYLNVFRFPGKKASVGELWSYILQLNVDAGNTMKRWKPEIDVILKQGSLSQRIISALNGDYSRDNIISVYKKLSTCLEQNKMFLV